MTSDDMFKLIFDAPESERESLAEKLLSEYDGADKALVEPWVWEAIAVASTEEIVISSS